MSGKFAAADDSIPVSVDDLGFEAREADWVAEGDGGLASSDIDLLGSGRDPRDRREQQTSAPSGTVNDHPVSGRIEVV